MKLSAGFPAVSNRIQAASSPTPQGSIHFGSRGGLFFRFSRISKAKSTPNINPKATINGVDRISVSPREWALEINSKNVLASAKLAVRKMMRTEVNRLKVNSTPRIGTLTSTFRKNRRVKMIRMPVLPPPGHHVPGRSMPQSTHGINDEDVQAGACQTTA